jgi:hypothetical protein
MICNMWKIYTCPSCASDFFNWWCLRPKLSRSPKCDVFQMINISRINSKNLMGHFFVFEKNTVVIGPFIKRECQQKRIGLNSKNIIYIPLKFWPLILDTLGIFLKKLKQKHIGDSSSILDLDIMKKKIRHLITLHNLCFIFFRSNAQKCSMLKHFHFECVC